MIKPLWLTVLDHPVEAVGDSQRCFFLVRQSARLSPVSRQQSSYSDRDAEPVGHSAFRLSTGLTAQVNDSIEGFVLDAEAAAAAVYLSFILKPTDVV